MDNGWPWGASHDVPTSLALWLIGLGLGMIWNPPCQPQKNGVVERSQGVAQAWAEPQQCRSVAELQRRLDHEDRLQREEYPSIAGQARLVAYPQLRHSGRSYNAAREEAMWDLQRVCDHLSEYVWSRQVDSQGKISLYHVPRYVGKQFAGRTVSIQFDPQARLWLVRNAAGQQLRELPAPEISADKVRALQVSPPRTGHRQPAGQ